MICMICQKEFTPIQSNSKCCSTECKKVMIRLQKRKYRESHKACVVCGAMFSPARIDSDCCSIACRRIKYRDQAVVVPQTRIDDIERYARAKGLHYADLQKQKTLAGIPKIDINI